MQKEIPNFLIELFLKQYGQDVLQKIIEGYSSKRDVTLRVNTIKSNIEEIKAELTKAQIQFIEINWNKDALIIKVAREEELKKLDIYEQGKIYLQSLSSMIPPLILEPKEGENILDMAAAPGGKTTQIAALTNNKCMITACEKKQNKI